MIEPMFVQISDGRIVTPHGPMEKEEFRAHFAGCESCNVEDTRITLASIREYRANGGRLTPWMEKFLAERSA